MTGFKAYVWPADMWACGHVRLLWPARTIHESEPDVDVEVIEPRKDGETGLRTIMRGGEVIDAHCPEDADLLVFQRPTIPDLAAAIPFFRAKGIAVVVDIDDDLSHIDPANPAWIMMHPDRRSGRMWSYESQATRDHIVSLVRQRLGDDAEKASDGAILRLAGDLYQQFLKSIPRHSWRSVQVAAAAATVTTVSTSALTQRYGKGNAVVVENCVPARFLDVPRVDSEVVGWPGSMHSHPGDLAVMGGAIATLVREGHEFLVVGDSTGAERELGMAEVPMTGPVDFHGWIEAVAQLGVGVAPLADSRFNEAKSALKVLELSAAGVPWVASPRAEYRRFHERHKVGFVAEKPREWLRTVRRLATDPVLRSEQSEAVRDAARGLTIEANAWRLAEVWHDAVETERQNRPVRSVSVGGS